MNDSKRKYEYNRTVSIVRNVDGISTQFITIGPGLDDDFTDVHLIIFLITGNPGLIDYYTEFLEELNVIIQNNFANAVIPIWGVSMAGHVTETPKNETYSSISNNDDKFSLDGQIEHKISILNGIVPSHCKLILLGHSIGSKMILEILRRSDNLLTDRILQTYLLFPTIERMRETPNGKRLWPLLSYRRFFLLLLKPIFYLPTSFHSFLLGMYLRKEENPHVFAASLKLFHEDVLARVMFLADCELKSVLKLDVDTMGKFKNKIFVYFGTSDEWCPLDFAHNMISSIQGLQYQICEEGLAHAFVLKSSQRMAHLLGYLHLNKTIMGAKVGNRSLSPYRPC